MDAHSWMCHCPEVPTIQIARADLGDGLDARGAGAVRHPDGRLACCCVTDPAFSSTVSEKSQTRKRGIRRDQVVGALGHLLECRHLTLSHGGPDLHLRLKGLSALPF